MTLPPLDELNAPADFSNRHIGIHSTDLEHMLQVIGASSLDDMIETILPEEIRISTFSPDAEGRCEPLSEQATLERLREYAAMNRQTRALIGMGYHGVFTPPVIQRNVLENPAWYTAYTPYQAEISQGRLEVLLAFQQMIVELTGMEVANASLLDEATAAAEAASIALRAPLQRTLVADATLLVDSDTHPQTLGVLRTRMTGLGVSVVVGDPFAASTDLTGFFAVLLSYPGSTGAIRPLGETIKRIHEAGGRAIVATDPLALMVLPPPGPLGADIVIGSAQRFGVPMGYGGPHAAFMATRENLRRMMPGRLIGVSHDRADAQTYRMALQTREQHIRRERATSNICTSQVLLAIIAALYAIWHGSEGLRLIALRTHHLATLFAHGIEKLGFRLAHRQYFDTVAIHAKDAASILHAARKHSYSLREIDGEHIGVAFDETCGTQTVADLLEIFAPFADNPAPDLEALRINAASPLADSLRAEPVLAHPVFTPRSETEMMRWLRQLAQYDIALDRSMIPLGSCTMKLNAAAEMMAVTWPEFANLHPFAPRQDGAGYHRIFADLEASLRYLTGFAAISLQPNAGSQGEYAGLLVIRRHHQERGEGHRRICLIPGSAHGTNPASAVLAGLTVVVLACDAQGAIDMEDLRARIATHGHELAALMITYPSTHGVFEPTIREVCALTHEAGALVYMDGANFNAMAGIVRPVDLGADVMHINLHKTFCIPHGGGGPGMGPIGVVEKLAPYLPDHPVTEGVNPADPTGKHAIGPISAAPWGSPLILPISWAYITMMGLSGLRKASATAILSANYVARRLAPYFSILYSGQGGTVAHECILDFRNLREQTGLSTEDVAKRLIDFGFHAPTLSWPVSETLMIEPTESESLAELERFCSAMIIISEEIQAIREGRMDREDNPLRNAPHHPEDLVATAWQHGYSRNQAAYPAPWVADNKYWPPVRRIDNVYGDRNPFCLCPLPDEINDAAE